MHKKRRYDARGVIVTFPLIQWVHTRGKVSWTTIMEGDVMRHYVVLLNIVQFVFVCKYDCKIRRTTILRGYGCGSPTEEIRENVIFPARCWILKENCCSSSAQRQSFWFLFCIVWIYLRGQWSVYIVTIEAPKYTENARTAVTRASASFSIVA